MLDECRRLFAPRPTPAGVVVPRHLRIECRRRRPAVGPRAGVPAPAQPRPRRLGGAGAVQLPGAGARRRRPARHEPLEPRPLFRRPARGARLARLDALRLRAIRWRPPDPAAAEAVRILDDEHDHVIRLPLPPSLTGGRPVFMGVTVFCRRQLPAGFLVERIYPLLVWPERVDTHLVLPLKWWPAKLIERSRAAAARKLAEQERSRRRAAAREERRCAPPVPPPLHPRNSQDGPSRAGLTFPAPSAPPPLPPAPDPAARRRYLQNPVRLPPPRRRSCGKSSARPA